VTLLYRALKSSGGSRVYPLMSRIGIAKKQVCPISTARFASMNFNHNLNILLWTSVYKNGEGLSFNSPDFQDVTRYVTKIRKKLLLKSSFQESLAVSAVARLFPNVKYKKKESIGIRKNLLQINRRNNLSYKLNIINACDEGRRSSIEIARTSLGR